MFKKKEKNCKKCIHIHTAACNLCEFEATEKNKKPRFRKAKCLDDYTFYNSQIIPNTWKEN